MRTPPSKEPLRWRLTAVLLAGQLVGMAARRILRAQQAKKAQLQQAGPAPVVDPPPIQQQPVRQAVHTIPDEVVQRLIQPTPSTAPPTTDVTPDKPPINWSSWAFYLALRLFLVMFTVVVLDIAASTGVRSYLYFSILPSIGALLITYRKPRKHHDPDNIAGIVTMCGVLFAVIIWPYYFYASATAPIAPAAIIATQTFSVGADSTPTCISLVDSQQREVLTARSLLNSVRDNRIVLYRTAFGWTPNSRPTQSPTPFFNIEHLNQVSYVLAPVDGNAPSC
jgi:hypothetical protein